MDGPHATNAIRDNAYNYFWKKNGYKVLFVECLCDDEELLERNEKVGCGHIDGIFIFSLEEVF